MQKLEQKYGIPTFETCKKLSEYWKEETNLCWSKNRDGLYIGLNTYYNEDEDYYSMNEVLEKNATIISTNSFYSENTEVIYAAPQIHELIQVLPNTIIYENYFYDLKFRKNCVFYSGLNRDIFEFENDNIAECLAQLYLTLKEKELL